MKKLLAGIAEFQKNVAPSYREKFAKLALGQSPDCLMVACSDSRVVPNLFASTEPGDLFVVRNVGNMVPPCGPDGLALMDRSEGAAVEFAVSGLKVGDVIVCGHSECGAMRALLGELPPVPGANLSEWLSVGHASRARLDTPGTVGAGLEPHNRLSQLHVLQQLENLRSYPAVQARIAEGSLNLHAWWFDIRRAEVLAFDAALGAFAPIVRSTEQA